MIQGNICQVIILTLHTIKLTECTLYHNIVSFGGSIVMRYCFNFSIQVGLARGNAGTGLSHLVAQAKEEQQIRAEMVCDVENRGSQ